MKQRRVHFGCFANRTHSCFRMRNKGESIHPLEDLPMMTKHQIETESQELAAALFKHDHKICLLDNVAEVTNKLNRLKAMSENGEYVDEMNDNGNAVYREFFYSRDPMHYSMRLSIEEGWEQLLSARIDGYRCVWFNPNTREILTFCGGDEIRIECPTVESFQIEFKDQSEIYRND